MGKGKRRLTAEGHRVALTEPFAVTVQYLERYPSFVEFFHGKTPVVTPPTVDPGRDDPTTLQERIENAVAKMNRDLGDSLMEEVQKISAYDFERLVLKLLVAMGYGTTAKVTRRSGDEGIDGVLKADRFGFDSVYVQAKQWKTDSVVGRPEVQKFAGAMMGKARQKACL